MLTILFCVSSCSNEENPTASKLKGNWQLTEVYFQDEVSGEFGWHPVEESYFLKFDPYLTFSSNLSPSCSKGIYYCNPNTLELHYNCQSDFSDAYDIIELQENLLIISRKNTIDCLGICQYKFIKTD